jgi:hypothetical protein
LPQPGSLIGPRQTLLGSRGFAMGAVRASLSANVSCGSLTDVVIPFDVEQFDVSHWHDTTTHPGRYTPKIGGIYRVSVTSRWSGTLPATKETQLGVLKNGATWGRVIEYTGAATSEQGQHFSDLVPLNGHGDYLEAVVQQSDASARDLRGASAVRTFWAIEFVGRLAG